MDAHHAIRTGQLRGEPSYCPVFCNWKYQMVTDLEDSNLEIKKFEVVVALDPAEEYEKSPLIILVTGYWR